MSHKYPAFRLFALLVVSVTLVACAARNSAVCNTIMGSTANVAATKVVGATIGGGGEPAFPNQVTGDYGTIGGGLDNVAGDRATVAGGSHNAALAFRATVGGGSNNTASTAYATVAGGTNNTASFHNATVGGGIYNMASGRNAVVAGGSGNSAIFSHATIAGGANNLADSIAATVAGGSRNTASGGYAVVSGGSGNRASGLDTAINGGAGNLASGEYATIGGGLVNRATGKYSLVGGGLENLAGTANDDQVQYATVGGGAYNTASGPFSTVQGGSANSAASAYSFAAGRRAKIEAAHAGTFLYADANDLDFDSMAANEFAVRATCGVRFVTAVDGFGNPIAGVRLAKGSGSWEFLSDRNAKTNIAPVDGREMLERLMSVPISTWTYKTEDASIRHIGPMAQDLAVFGVGGSDSYISMVDANGVALAAMQGLYQVVQEKDIQIASQQRQIAELESRIATLEQRISQNGMQAQPVSWTYGWLLFTSIGLAGLALAQRWCTR